MIQYNIFHRGERYKFWVFILFGYFFDNVPRPWIYQIVVVRGKYFVIKWSTVPFAMLR